MGLTGRIKIKRIDHLQIRQRVDRLVSQRIQAAPQVWINPYEKYRGRPAAYIREVLRACPTPVQVEIAESLVRPPYQTLVKSGHNVGKSWLGAALISWHFDAYRPGIVMSTAPKKEQVRDVLWKEVRAIRGRAGLEDHFIGPAACEMRTSYNHFALGTVATSSAAFQGHHDAHILFVVEECVGVNPFYWEAIRTMHKGNGRQFVLAIGNPVTTTCQAYIEDNLRYDDGRRHWASFEMSSLDHPNIKQGLDGADTDQLDVPNAVDVGQVDKWINSDWFDLVPEGEEADTDVLWPPAGYGRTCGRCPAPGNADCPDCHGLGQVAGQYYRPGPEGEARVLGRWPSTDSHGVWSALRWRRATETVLEYDPRSTLPTIGCDVARGGFCNTAIHVRWGPCSLHHETHNGWMTDRTADRLAELAGIWAAKATALRHPGAQPVRGQEIMMLVDETGVGAGVIDPLVRDGYTVKGVNSASPATTDRYPNIRSELWFQLAERARLGRLDLHRLSKRTLATLRQQAMSPTWKSNGMRQRVVQTKEEMEKELKRSPDDMDAMNLAYLEGQRYQAPEPADQGLRGPLDPLPEVNAAELFRH